MIVSINMEFCRAVAQLVEQRPPKPKVGGSSPSSPAKISIASMENA